MKKLIILFVLSLVICFNLNRGNSPVVQAGILPTSEITNVYVRESKEIKLDSIQDYLLSKYTFIHSKNLKNLDKSILSLMVSECDKYKLPYSIFFSVVDRESGFKFIPNSSGSGAMGFMQLMPRTFSVNAHKLGLSTHTPQNNIKVGAYHLWDLFSFWKKKYNDEKTAWTWALAQYAVGLGGLQRRDSNGLRYEIPKSTLSGMSLVLRNYEKDL